MGLLTFRKGKYSSGQKCSCSVVVVRTQVKRGISYHGTCIQCSYKRTNVE